MRSHSIWFLALACATLSGCATVGGDLNSQAILVQSAPPGATIIIKDRSVGKTPRYVQLERERRPSLELKLGNERELVEVDTKYRWGDSFWKNFVFLGYAPVGWIIDLVSGAAWQAQDPPVVEFKPRQEVHWDKTTSSRAVRPRIIAIAPPQAETISLSDTGGTALERELLSSGYKVVPYKETLSIFIKNGYDFDGAPDEYTRKFIYYSLGVDAVYESRIEPKGTHLVLRGEALDVISRTTEAPTELMFEPSGEIEHLYSGRGIFQFLPNTIAVDLVSENLSWTQGNETIELVPAQNETGWAKGLRYISALNITNLPPRRPGRSARGVLNIVPHLRLSRKNVMATGAPDVEGREFVRWFASAGYGLEAGLQISRHFLYFRLIPQFYWNRISWETDGTKTAREGSGLNLVSELGYLLFFDSRWNARLFVRSANEDSDTWSEALGKSSSSTQVASAGLNTFGISIGYRFEPSIQDQRWRTPSRNRRE